jgi:hypothetical protein
MNRFSQLVGAGAAQAARFSDTELMARLVEGENTRFVRDKTHFLIALFKEAGDAAAAQDRAPESRAFYLSGLHLLLGTVPAGDSFQALDFAPGLETFVTALAEAPLPTRTLAMLMRHYEQRGAFAKAEDALFDLLDAEPGNSDVLDVGMEFYERLRGQSDVALADGNLPRQELEAGAAELRQRRAS